MSLPELCLVDTNVPKTANLASQAEGNSGVPDQCVLACIVAIEHVIKTRGLVIDEGGEIFDEYRQNLSMRGQPGVGDRFMKWVHDNRWGFHESQRVSVTKKGNSYVEFPVHADLAGFDPSDMKFVAVANHHPDKPPILQATDSKWWEWNDALKDSGITVCFLCSEFVQSKYAKKIGP